MISETYKRQAGIIGKGGQEKLKNSTVLIVGAGGIGNITAKYLASSGVGKIHIMDSDEVEQSNLNRQILFNEESIGKNKAESLAKTLKKINSEVEVSGINARFDNNVGELLIYKYDLILDCTDDITSSLLIEQRAIALGIPMVFAKTSKFFGTVAVLGDRPYLGANYPTKQLNKDNSVFPPIGGVIGSYQASLALKLLLGIKVTDDMLHIDLLNDRIFKYPKK
jgi:molybdopterin/thiamine biosynthesis adenylyltransferase